MMRKIKLIVVLSIVALNAAAAAPLPNLPGNIIYDSLKWNVPLGDPYRVTLKNGLKAYIAVDSGLPLVQISAHVRHGSLLDPKGKEGLSAMMGSLMRIGGTARFKADTMTGLLDLFAMKLSLSVSEDQTTLSASFLSDFTDTAFLLLQQVMLYPVFDEKKIEKEKSILKQKIVHRFDNPGPTLDAAYQKMMYPKNPAGSIVTEKSVNAITRRDLVDLHRQIFRANNIIFTIAGKFDRPAMVERLEKLFPAAKETPPVSFPAIAATPAVKCLIVHKPITQIYVRLGIPLFMRPNADYYPVSVLNLILGGGGFTSRLGTKVRSDAGLTYSIYSTAESNYTFQGTWYIEFFTKNESFPLAMSLILKELEGLRARGVTASELSSAKASLVGELPSMFRSPADIVSTYGWNEYYGRKPTQYKDYPDSIKVIGLPVIKAMAQKYLDPSTFTYAIVGDTAALARYNSAEGFSLDSLLPKKTIVADSIPLQP